MTWSGYDLAFRPLSVDRRRPHDYPTTGLIVSIDHKHRTLLEVLSSIVDSIQEFITSSHGGWLLKFEY